jgi:hypothetical protein
MNDDVQKFIYSTLIIFVFGMILWIGFLFINACSFTLTCSRGALIVERTPIPTLWPAALPTMKTGRGIVVVSVQCQIAAVDLIGAWVDAGSPETKSFQFTDLNGQHCETTYKEIEALFVKANLWYSDSLSCTSCHSVDLTISPAQLDLSSYAGIMSGSRRPDPKSDLNPKPKSKPKGTDILGGGKWKGSLLYEFLSTSKANIPGHDNIASALVIFAGKLIPAQSPTPTLDSTITPMP